jgi:pilus assembly protein CpaB
MLLRVALFAMLAVGVITSSIVAWVMLAPAKGPPVAELPALTKTTILVSGHGLRAGALIKPEDLLAQEVVRVDMPPGASPDTAQGRNGLTGAMVRRSISEGQPILPADVVHPGDHGFLAAVLGPNMCAITVAVDDVSGTAGLIWPGDRVDLILTQALDDPTLTPGRRVAAETVLSDARVIAIDQQIVQGQAPAGTVSPAIRTATLEVTAGQAERVLVAGRLGKLSLSVLSANRRNDNAAVQRLAELPTAIAVAKITDPSAASPQPSVTWAGDVSPALGSGDSRKPPTMVHVFQGVSDSKEFHF